jgi:hypothetical protein
MHACVYVTADPFLMRTESPSLSGRLRRPFARLAVYIVDRHRGGDDGTEPPVTLRWTLAAIG